ncbi:hypothetical protein ONS96_010915 [Cadophora gregata f. sp. sojae]|nr:hypothetical protein ONS96_010915 [Cadophora gregata f. sp. sojae]
MLPFLFLTFISAWSLCLQVLARECGNETGFISGIIVWSQEDADIKLDSCTKLISTLTIGHNYTGDFVLRGVTNLTSQFTTSIGYTWTSPYETEEGVPGLTSVTAPDLLEIGSYSLDLQNATALKSVSFEKLRKAYNLDIELGTLDSSLSFPALETVVGRLQILGNFSSMNFKSLTSVGSSVTIRSRRESSDNDYMYSLEAGTNSPLDIEFPLLVNCSTLKIIGNISRISMPKLETIADFTGNSMFYDYGHDLSVYTQGQPLNLSFPILWNISDIALAGTFGNISLPALKDVEEYTVRSKLPISVNLTPLETAESIYFYGNVTDYNITSLTSISEDLYISSELSPDCGPGKEKWLELHPEYSDRKTYIPGFSCKAKTKKHFPGKQVALGLGIGIPLLVIFAAVIWRCKRNSSNKKLASKDRLPDYETEMETRRIGGGEILPEYAPPAEWSSSDRVSPVSSVGNVSRPTGRPPGYEAANTQESHVAQVQRSRDPLV